MTTLEPAITVHEVSMQEWAMAAFHAARAPQRVRVTVKTVTPSANRKDTVCRAAAYRWLLLATAIGCTAWWVI